MTKAFTALAILKLRDDGKLRLDDLAEQHVPEMKGWVYPTKDSPRIRIRDLLHHVGGLVTDDPWGDRQQVLPQDDFTKMIAAGVPFSRIPQSQHEYSNLWLRAARADRRQCVGHGLCRLCPADDPDPARHDQQRLRRAPKPRRRITPAAIAGKMNAGRPSPR